MADKKQLAILKKGVKTWNKWRERNPDAKIDLERAVLSGAKLSGVDLHGANLCGANLVDVDLRGANLNSADLSHLPLREGLRILTVLSNGNLQKVPMMDTDLTFADLRNVDLTRAHLDRADLTFTNLSGGSLRNADLRSAHISSADFRKVDLYGAWLIDTHFRETKLSEADMTKAILNQTDFVEIDLSEVTGLANVEHAGPSAISISTIYKSKGNIPKAFLAGCGVPENFITFMHSLTGKAFEFYSCFISHSGKDKRFCERLYADLQAKGVRVWYFPEDAKWGETVWGEIDRSIKVYDKLVVVLSENSLQSVPVNREIERALNREDKEGKGILFPIRIDDYVFNTWEHERKADVLRKVVGDFSSWDKDAAKYDKAFDKLLKGLQAV